LRVLRLISINPNIRRVVQALLSSLPGMGSIAMLLGLVFYVAAVMATQLFGEAFPEWFGSLGASLYTLFQVMTLESWSMGIVRPVMETFPLAWMYFLPFILIATFMMLNLFIAVVVNAMQTTHEQEAKLAPPSPTEQLLLDELRALRTEVAELRQQR
jgi:voltage-gated sodium channel